MANEDLWAQLNDDQKAKAASCKTPEELLALAHDEGYELSDEELKAVAGGWGDQPAQPEEPRCEFIYIVCRDREN